MSQSQETASAVRELERQKAEWTRKAEAFRASAEKALADVVDARAKERAAMSTYVEEERKRREAEIYAAELRGAIVTMNGPRGYGGAPAILPPLPYTASGFPTGYPYPTRGEIRRERRM